jgi:serine/threonine-protein kinase
MNPERWREVSRIYGAVLTRSESDRPGVLADLCANDQELRREVESLLASGAGAALLDRVAVDRPSVMAMTNGITVGSRIGVFEIQSLLGVGGMGEVYRARDTKLNRDVAIKILPQEFAADPDRLARFKREAQVLASLNHPNIGGIYGFEDAGGTHALVLELVEGPTLADRIARGALPHDEALPIASQVADALEVAHEQGIVHRDLKPANIKVRDDGTVKVLDFGLAKFSEAPSPRAPEARAPRLSQSPTITTPAMTAAGMILGTAAYMSPEQAKGRPADRRSDIWAFGCVLYEMLCGRRPFEGEDISDTLAAILRAEPDWSRLPPDTPASIRTLIEQCLTKDLAKRPSHIAVAKFLLTAKPAATTTDVPPSAPVTSRSMRWLAASALVLAVGGVASAWLWRGTGAVARADVARFTIALPADDRDLPGSAPRVRFTNAGRPVVAVSPDGTQIAFVADSRIHLRHLSDFASRPVVGTEAIEGITSPVFSPNGRWLAYYSLSDSAIKRISIEGGTPTPVCPSPNPMGLAWEGDFLFFGAGDQGIMRVPANGGTPERIASVEDQELAAAPALVPGGKAVLFVVGSRAVPGFQRDAGRIVVQPLPSGPRTVVVADATSPIILPTGHLLYTQGGSAFAVAWDNDRLATKGTPVLVVQGIRRTSDTGSPMPMAHLSLSLNGTVAYVPGPVNPSLQTRALILSDREGKVTRLPIPSMRYMHPRVSRDNRLAVEIDEGSDANIWTYDLEDTKAMQRLTSGGRNRLPIWSPDGKRVAFQSDRDGDAGIFEQAIGDGRAVRLTTAESGEQHTPGAWSPDGKTLLFSKYVSTAPPERRFSLWSRAEGRIAPFGDIQSAEPIPISFSPDGRWVTYARTALSGGRTASERGVFVRRFPQDEAVYAVPKERIDFHPLWVPGRDEIIFAPSAGRLVVVPIRPEPSPTFGRSVEISAAAAPDRLSVDIRDFDLLKDGRFLGSVPDTNAQGISSLRELSVITNWFTELRDKVPAR